MKVSVARKMWGNGEEVGGQEVSALPGHPAGGGVVLAVQEFEPYEPVGREGVECPGGQRVQGARVRRPLTKGRRGRAFENDVPDEACTGGDFLNLGSQLG